MNFRFWLQDFCHTDPVNGKAHTNQSSVFTAYMRVSESPRLRSIGLLGWRRGSFQEGTYQQTNSQQPTRWNDAWRVIWKDRERAPGPLQQGLKVRLTQNERICRGCRGQRDVFAKICYFLYSNLCEWRIQTELPILVTLAVPTFAKLTSCFAQTPLNVNVNAVNVMLV